MQKKWTGKSIDLTSLSDSVEEFFKSQQFRTKTTKSVSDITITLLPKPSTMRLEEPISVRISGSPDDFTVDLKASELTARPIRTGLLTKSLGGGYFLLKTFRLQEELERLEKEFWIYLERKIAELTESA